MAKKRKISILLAALAVVCAVGIGLFYSRYIVINDEIIRRNEAELVLTGDALPDIQKLQRMAHLRQLDLREIPIQPAEYEHLQQTFPDCRILWKVPFQNGYWDNQSTEVSISVMNAHEKAMLEYFPHLKTLDARGCPDYESLAILRAENPDWNVMYTMDLGDVQLRENTTECTVTDNNIRNLIAFTNYLPELEAVDATACRDYEAIMTLLENPKLKLEYAVEIGGIDHRQNTTQITLENANVQEALERLRYLPHLTDMTFIGEIPNNEDMYLLKSQYPHITMHWEFELFGVPTSSTATELILNEIPMESTDEIENALKYFYRLERVEMCDCGISGEDMDALNQRHPDTRFIWMVHVGVGSLRTDAVGCIPYHLNYNLHRPFYDKEAKDLKYCTDLIALDLGHMMVSDLSMLQYMPNLKYLILGDMERVEDFSYIAGLEELVFLEIFQTKFTDVSLLMNMKKLEDLNISWTNLENPELLKEMTWLKRLWCTNIGTSKEFFQELSAALPDTLVYYTSFHPTEGGWRNSQNYRDMRDTLNMFYME